MTCFAVLCPYTVMSCSRCWGARDSMYHCMGVLFSYFKVAFGPQSEDIWSLKETEARVILQSKASAIIWLIRWLISKRKEKSQKQPWTEGSSRVKMLLRVHFYLCIYMPFWKVPSGSMGAWTCLLTKAGLLFSGDLMSEFSCVFSKEINCFTLPCSIVLVGKLALGSQSSANMILLKMGQTLPRSTQLHYNSQLYSLNWWLHLSSIRKQCLVLLLKLSSQDLIETTHKENPSKIYMVF